MKRDLTVEWELQFPYSGRVIFGTSPYLVCLKLLPVRGIKPALALTPFGNMGWVLAGVAATFALLYWAIARLGKSRVVTPTPQNEGLIEDSNRGRDPDAGPDESPKGLPETPNIKPQPSTLILGPGTVDLRLDSWQLHINRMPLAHLLCDSEGRLVAWNPAAENLFGYSSQEVIGQKFDLLIPPQTQPQVAEVFQRLSQGDLNAHSIHENRTKSGNLIVCEWYNTPLFSPQNQFIGSISMVQNITDRWESETALKDLSTEMTTILDEINEVVLLFDSRGSYLKIFPADSPLLERSGSELLGKTLHDVFEPPLADRFLGYITTALEEQQSLDVEYDLLCLGDRPVSFSAKISPLDRDRVLCVARDITDRKQVEDLLRRYAFCDPLTGLANRCSFVKCLRTAIQNSQPNPEVRSFRVAVLLLDIDRFGMVKYSLGHWVADRLLIATAQRLQSCLNSGATLSRIGGDEFAILLNDITTLADVTQLADRIQSVMRFPFSLDEHEIFSSVSIGIALDSGEYQQSAELLRDADTALHYAKQQGQGHSVAFSQDMHEGAVARLQLETDLQRAIAQTAHPNPQERPPFQVYYQPIISLATGRIVGFEALVRWHHPTRGFVPPDEFIPVAEETGQIGAIDRWVMAEACRQLGFWHRHYPSTASLTMSVNVSGVNFGQVGAIERIEQILRSSGISGRSLKLEITESALLKNTRSALALLDRIKALGIDLSIDDFGTGYSSLARLHELPINTLKIDRSFVSRMRGLDESSQIVLTTIALAHTLGLDAIAEGVETDEQVELLRSLECDYAQGYFFSRPVDSEAALTLILNENKRVKNG